MGIERRQVNNVERRAAKAAEWRESGLRLRGSVSNEQNDGEGAECKAAHGVLQEF